MSVELIVLALGCVLGVVQIFVAAQLATRQYGVAWGFSPRDFQMPPPTPLVGRMTRARTNFLETFPIAAAALIMIEISGLTNGWTALGAVIWLAARVMFVPVYAFGIPVLRTILFGASIVGIGMLIWPVLI